MTLTISRRVPVRGIRVGSRNVARGSLITYKGTDPAAGATSTETVPAEKEWLLLSVQFSFVADATAVVRVPVLTIDDGTNVVYKMKGSAGSAANTTLIYCFANWGANIPTANSDAVHAFAMPQLSLFGGYRISIPVINLQAADNMSLPVYQVVEYDS